jgi:hypothetical protein
VIDSNAPLRQQLLHVAIGLQIPSHCHHDHFRWEAETGEARPRRGHWGRATTHQPSLPVRGGPSTQQRPASVSHALLPPELGPFSSNEKLCCAAVSDRRLSGSLCRRGRNLGRRSR